MNKYSIKYYILNIILYLCGKIEKNEVEQNKNSLGRKEFITKMACEATWKKFITINAYCCNRQQPNLDTLYKIAKLLSVELKDLIVDKTIEENVE